MSFKFKTRFNSTPFKGEKNNGEFMIDPTGYIPAKRQIENMLYAGAQLDQSRLDDYDFRPGEKLEYKKSFGMRAPDLDQSDISRIMRDTLEGSDVGEAGSGSDDGATPGSGDSTPGEGSESGSRDGFAQNFDGK